MKKSCPIEHIADRAASYGMPGIAVDGNDVNAVYEAVYTAANRARQGGGPSLVENITYRWRGHSKSDANRYRSKEEIEEWKQKCPIRSWEEYLLSERQITTEEIESIKSVPEVDSGVFKNILDGFAGRKKSSSQ